MKKKLKVYGFRGWRKECPAAPNGNKQTREIVAAHSKAQVKAATNVPAYEIEETGNDEEVKLAMSEPGRIFWQPHMRSNDTNWRKAEKIEGIDAPASAPADYPDAKDAKERLYELREAVRQYLAEYDHPAPDLMLRKQLRDKLTKLVNA